MLSAVGVAPGKILHDTLSKRKLNADIEKLAAAIEGRYKSHTKEALPLKKAKEFKYFKLNQRRKTLYMFNPADVSVKYSYKSEEKYDLMVDAFTNFKAEHPTSFVVCLAGGCCFTDFTVLVTPCYGELKFQKGNTDESSSDSDTNPPHD